MNRVARFLIRCYPGAWRARYGDELGALVEDTGADTRTLFNLISGGFRMQLSLRSAPRLIAALALLGALIGFGGSYLLTPQYTSKATLEITPSMISSDQKAATIVPQLNERIMAMQQNVLSRTSLAAIIRDPRLDLYSTERLDTPLEDVIERMKRDIAVEIIALSGQQGKFVSAFNIAFTYRDRFKTQQAVQKLMIAFDEANQSLASNTNIDVLDSPNLPVSPVFPNRYTITFAGAFWGTILGFAIWLIRRPRPRKLSVVDSAAETATSPRPSGPRLSRLVIFFVPSGLVLAAAISLLVPNVYLSSAIILPKSDSPTPDATLVGLVMRAEVESLSRNALSGIIQSLRLYPEDLQSQPLEDLIARMKSNIEIEIRSGAPAVKVSFQYTDRYAAQRAVQHLLAELNKSARNNGFAFQVIDAPNLPQSPVKPNRKFIAFLGAVAGLIIAILVRLTSRPKSTAPNPEPLTA